VRLYPSGVAAETVVAHGADVGICLDGDADRVISTRRGRSVTGTSSWRDGRTLEIDTRLKGVHLSP
jgi:hypothetical protein